MFVTLSIQYYQLWTLKTPCLSDKGIPWNYPPPRIQSSPAGLFHFYSRESRTKPSFASWGAHRKYSLACQLISRWWFQIFFDIHIYLGKWSILTNIFEMGWFNHQLDIHLLTLIKVHLADAVLTFRISQSFWLGFFLSHFCWFHPRVFTNGGSFFVTENDGLKGKGGKNSFEIWPFLECMMDFWGVYGCINLHLSRWEGFRFPSTWICRLELPALSQFATSGARNDLETWRICRLDGICWVEKVYQS